MFQWEKAEKKGLGVFFVSYADELYCFQDSAGNNSAAQIQALAQTSIQAESVKQSNYVNFGSLEARQLYFNKKYI